MNFRGFSAFIIWVALVGPLRASGPYLHGFDPISLLPPPPPSHSVEDVADRDSTFRIYAARTPEDVARGKAEHNVSIYAFTPAIGAFFQPGKFPKLEALLKESEAEVKPVVDAGKNYWKRPRPFREDPARFSEPADPERSPGYPSGHATLGTFFALLLSEVFPEQREAILQKGCSIGWTRVQLGVHTPLDIYAGRVLGLALAKRVLADPAFQCDFAAAKAEVKANRYSQNPPDSKAVFYFRLSRSFLEVRVPSL